MEDLLCIGIADPSELLVLSLGDGTKPMLAGSFALSNRPGEFAVAGDLIYASTSDGLAILRVTSYSAR